MDEVISEEWAYIQESGKTAAASLQKLSVVSVQVQDELSRPVGFGNVKHGDYDFQMLINMRRKHQTKQAAAGVRTQNVTSIADKTAGIRHSVIRELHAALKEGQDCEVGPTAGVDRQTRWDCLPSGNTANAAVVAANASKQVCLFCLR